MPRTYDLSTVFGWDDGFGRGAYSARRQGWTQVESKWPLGPYRFEVIQSLSQSRAPKFWGCNRAPLGRRHRKHPNDRGRDNRRGNGGYESVTLPFGAPGDIAMSLVSLFGDRQLFYSESNEGVSMARAVAINIDCRSDVARIVGEYRCRICS